MGANGRAGKRGIEGAPRDAATAGAVYTHLSSYGLEDMVGVPLNSA